MATSWVTSAAAIPRIRKTEEGQQQHGRAGELADRAYGVPALRRRLDQGEDQQQHPGRHEHRTDDVEAGEPRAPPVARDDPERRRQQQHADRRVHEQHPAPSRPVGQQTAEQDSGRRSQPADTAPDAQRTVPVGPVAERRRQEGEGGRQHHRRTKALREPGTDEHPRLGGQPPGERGQAEDRRTRDEDATAAQQVAGPPAQQHEAAVGEQVAAEHPLQALHREAQVVADPRQRHVDDRGVDEVEERHGTQQGEGEDSVPGGQGRGRPGHCRRLGQGGVGGAHGGASRGCRWGAGTASAPGRPSRRTPRRGCDRRPV
jgi:hypothetical protein